MQKFLLGILSLALITGAVMASDSKIVYGYVEKVILVDKDLELSAKLDTGAKSASLSAINIKEHYENGKHYLSFTVPTKQGDYKCKAEYVGKVNIKPRMGEYLKELAKFRPLRRPIVKMHIRLGKKDREILLNLTNRKRFNYSILLGRDAIVAFDGVVDPSRIFIIKDR